MNKYKIGIVTIIDNNNYGNRLQNYAVQETLKKFVLYSPFTILNKDIYNNKKLFLLRVIKNTIINSNKKVSEKRVKNFEIFNKNISFSNNIALPFFKLNYDKVFVGSDQVWNPFFGRLRDIDLLANVPPQKRYAFSASFGVSKLPKNTHQKVRKELSLFNKISVRENQAKEIVEELTGRTDVEVLVDPTMLLTSEEWDKVSKKPIQLNFNKYILNYFLGELSEPRRKEIERIAKENNCKIINILDSNDPFYVSGPSEFLYLEKHAFLICTDSFHSSVFAILYDRPFIVFDREDDTVKMNSRIDTLLDKFNLKNRRYTGTITSENLEHNYKDAYKILEEEKKKSFRFLEDALKG